MELANQLREVRQDLMDGEYVEWRERRPAARNAHTGMYEY